MDLGRNPLLLFLALMPYWLPHGLNSTYKIMTLIPPSTLPPAAEISELL
jgi:hypothetical protein